jgi:hypothetical protein
VKTIILAVLVFIAAFFIGRIYEHRANPVSSVSSVRIERVRVCDKERSLIRVELKNGEVGWYDVPELQELDQ